PLAVGLAGHPHAGEPGPPAVGRDPDRRDNSAPAGPTPTVRGCLSVRPVRPIKAGVNSTLRLQLVGYRRPARIARPAPRRRVPAPSVPASPSNRRGAPLLTDAWLLERRADAEGTGPHD